MHAEDNFKSSGPVENKRHTNAHQSSPPRQQLPFRYRSELSVCSYPLLDVLRQTLRNPDHLSDLAMGDSAANVATAHVPLFPERIEGADELGIFPQGQFQRRNDAVAMILPGCTISGGRTYFFS